MNGCQKQAQNRPVKMVEINTQTVKELRRRAGRMKMQNVPAIRAYGEGISDALKILGVWDIK